MQIDIKLRKWNKEKDYPVICQWYKDWGMGKPSLDLFPENVFIIDHVICASYYKTDSKVAYIENIISNPDCPTNIRQIGLGVAGDYIFKLAKEDGFKVVIGFTQNKSVAQVSDTHGMKISKYNWAIMTKDLGE